jgi:outer membrane protein OmpA-like peptidoglycan-associated protein
MLRSLWAAIALSLIVLPAGAQAQVHIVFFADWSGAVDDSAKNVIDQAAAAAKHLPDAEITVTGYADSTGSERANVYLTELRAQRVIDALVADGVPASRLKMVAAGRQPQVGVVGRRVEISIGQ